MRREIFEKVSDALRTLENSNGERVVRHVDLWNHNVEFIEQEEAWERPAVFLEFGPISWHPVKGCHPYGECELRLHIVTDWQGDVMSVFDLCLQIRELMCDLSGETFHVVRPLSSHTNHNHEELLETVEVYAIHGSSVCSTASMLHCD